MHKRFYVFYSGPVVWRRFSLSGGWVKHELCSSLSYERLNVYAFVCFSDWNILIQLFNEYIRRELFDVLDLFTVYAKRASHSQPQNNKSCQVNKVGNDKLDYSLYMSFVHGVQFGNKAVQQYRSETYRISLLVCTQEK